MLKKDREVIASGHTQIRKGGGGQTVMSLRKDVANTRLVQRAKGHILAIDVCRVDGKPVLMVWLE
jgi:hypothetical protein